MKLKIIFILFCVFSLGKAYGADLGLSFDRSVFYAILKGGTIEEIDTELAVVNASSIDEKEAYEGTLLMKKAGLTGKSGKKLKLFKQGRIKLETAIAKDSSNVEYHFLRLIIQEHAPKIAKYRKEVGVDSQMVIKSYKDLSPAVRKAVKDYSKSSKILHPEDF